MGILAFATAPRASFILTPSCVCLCLLCSPRPFISDPLQCSCRQLSLHPSVFLQSTLMASSTGKWMFSLLAGKISHILSCLSYVMQIVKTVSCLVSIIVINILSCILSLVICLVRSMLCLFAVISVSRLVEFVIMSCLFYL